jgi:hypothetical protein
MRPGTMMKETESFPLAPADPPPGPAKRTPEDNAIAENFFPESAPKRAGF